MTELKSNDMEERFYGIHQTAQIHSVSIDGSLSMKSVNADDRANLIENWSNSEIDHQEARSVHTVPTERNPIIDRKGNEITDFVPRPDNAQQSRKPSRELASR